ESRHLLALVPPDRQHDDRRRGPAPDAANHLGAVHVGQPEVEDHYVGAVGGHGGEPRSAVASRADLVVPRGQVDPQRPQDRRLVVDDQHPGQDSAPCMDSAPAVALATGSVIRTVSPPPGVSAATMTPPMASVKPLATARPSPPPALRPSNRRNGSKISAFSPSGTPGPWSMTSSTTVSSWRWACSTGGRAAGEWCSALENKFPRTRSSKPGSASTS